MPPEQGPAQPTGPVPGWYPDPANPAATRYWDGTAWTAQTQPPPYPHPYGAPAGFAAPAAAQPTPPPPAAPGGYPAAPTYQPAPGYPAAPGGPGGPGGYYGYAAPEKLGPTGTPFASFWRRLGGYLIDSLILAIPTALVTLPLLLGPLSDLIDEFQGIDPATLDPESPLYDPDAFTDAVNDILLSSDLWGTFIWIGVLSLLIQGIYWIVAIGSFGRTIGGAAVGIRAVDADGAIPGYGRASLRFAVPAGAQLIGFIPFIGFLGTLLQLLIYLWMLWDPNKQGLHDKAAGTYVVRS